MNLKECLEEIRKEWLKAEKTVHEKSIDSLNKFIEELASNDDKVVKVADDEDGKGFTITVESETPKYVENWKIRFRSDDNLDGGCEPENDDEPIDCGNGLFAAGEPKEDPNKVFGIFARIDEPRREDYETREAFEADHKKYDRAVDAIIACDWKNKSDDAPLHKVNAIRKEVGEMPPLNMDLVGETHWFDDWANEKKELRNPNNIYCDKRECWRGEEHVCDSECWCGEKHTREEKCDHDAKRCRESKCDSRKEENAEKLMKQVAEAISELVKDPDALAVLSKYAKNLL